MGLGTCRHCSADHIATDALVCRVCGGWKPNPGFFTRAGSLLQWIVLLVVFMGAAFSAARAALSDDPAMQQGLGISGTVAAVSLLCLAWSFIHPYGKPPL